MAFSFVHTGDLHLDSPFVGLTAEYEVGSGTILIGMGEASALVCQPPSSSQLWHGSMTGSSLEDGRPAMMEGDVARTWLSIQVDLVEGHGQHLWPRPGRLFVASRSHTFAQLADAIDDAFARWDRSHLHEFTLADGTRLTTPHMDWQEFGPAIDDQRERLGRLGLGEQFVYVFDLGDDWAHLCTVGPQRVDPLETYGIVPDGPVPYFGWGTIPDQYLRAWDGDDGESRRPRDRGLADLPPLRSHWGSPDR